MVGGQARGPDGELLLEVSEFLGEATNNVAEYLALIRLLEAARVLKYQGVIVRTDSELMANQVSGGFKVKSAALKPLVARVKALLAPYRVVEVEHIPREKNTECDRLANRAIDEGIAGMREPILGEGEEALF